MPDLITHTAVAYFVARPRSMARHRVALYVGAILPDLLSRPWYILFPKMSEYTIAMHTPIFSVLACLLIAQFFDNGIRKSVLWNLLAGVALHFFLDLLQRHLVPGYLLIFPFSWWGFEIGLFGPEQSIRFTPFWIVAIMLTEFVCWWWRRKKHNLKTG
jgi:hypothetical protein